MYITFSLFLNRHIRCFYTLDIVNDIAMNMKEKTSLPDIDFTFFGWITRLQIAEAYSASIFNILKSFHILSIMSMCCVVCHARLCPTLCSPHGLQPSRLLGPWGSLGKNARVGCHFLLQGMFPTQGLNLCLLHWQTSSLPLSHQRSPLLRNLSSKKGLNPAESQ